ncbi:type IV toxin-antitoxin system AbiEi family antitoxin domain-containing protein [Protaetiibacter intestinalis]|nr:type IV toxin-antitoxin system AbiEi family antitoxin domain-containing protein [Protaetiibacter intestinalis]
MELAPLADPSGLISTSDYLRVGSDVRELTRAVERGELVKLRRGSYVPVRRWDSAGPRERHLLRAVAASRAARRELPFAGATAAAIWEMWQHSYPEEVSFLDEWKGGGRSEPGVRRITAAASSAFVRRVDGHLVTGVARTAIDVARSAGDFTTAVGTLDWALWRRNPNRVTREELAAELKKLPTTLRRRFVERAIAFASPMSDSYAESYARALMYVLGYEVPVLQLEFPHATGSYFVDFAWPAYLVIAEIDGFGKYLDPSMNAGDPARVVLAEKLREDELRRRGYHVIRVYWSDLTNPVALVTKLDTAGIPRGRR